MDHGGSPGHGSRGEPAAGLAAAPAGGRSLPGDSDRASLDPRSVPGDPPLGERRGAVAPRHARRAGRPGDPLVAGPRPAASRSGTGGRGAGSRAPGGAGLPGGTADLGAAAAPGRAAPPPALHPLLLPAVDGLPGPPAVVGRASPAGRRRALLPPGHPQPGLRLRRRPHQQLRPGGLAALHGPPHRRPSRAIPWVLTASNTRGTTRCSP